MSTVTPSRAEAFYWATIMVSQTLGTAFGDLLANTGDLLDKPLTDGGLALSRIPASAVLAAVMIALVLAVPQRAGRHPG